VVTRKYFADTNAVPSVLVASIAIPMILLPLARWYGSRGAKGSADATDVS